MKNFIDSVKEMENLAWRQNQAQEDWEQDAYDPLERKMITKGGTVSDNRNLMKLFIWDQDDEREHVLMYPPTTLLTKVMNEISLVTMIPENNLVIQGFAHDITSMETLEPLNINGEVQLVVHRSCPEVKDSTEDHESSSCDEFEDAEEEALAMKSNPNSLKFTDNSPTIIKPLFASDVDEIKGAIMFYVEFQKIYGYGKPVPSFYHGTLSMAIRESIKLPAKSRKALAIFLHHGESKFTQAFCSETLCNITVVNIMKRDYVIWGWDVTLDSNRETLLKLVKNSVGVEMEEAISKRDVNEFPLIIIIHWNGGSYSISSIIQGDTNITNLIKILKQNMSGKVKKVNKTSELGKKSLNNIDKGEHVTFGSMEKDNISEAQIPNKITSSKKLTTHKVEMVNEALESGKESLNNIGKGEYITLEAIKKSNSSEEERVPVYTIPSRRKSSQQSITHEKHFTELKVEEVQIEKERPLSASPRTYNTGKYDDRPRGRGRKNKNWNNNTWRGRGTAWGRGYAHRDFNYTTGSWQQNNWTPAPSYASRGSKRKYDNSRLSGNSSVEENFTNYYESDIESQVTTLSLGGLSSASHSTGVTAISLIKALVEFNGFKATLLTLLDEKEFNHKLVKQIVRANEHVFQLEGESVALRPKISFCDQHLGSEGCDDPRSCKDLHFCWDFLQGSCEDEDCLYGHKLHTNHNKSILKSFNFNDVDEEIVLKILKEVVVAGDGCKVDDLAICEDYNQSSCEERKCLRLHLCLRNLGKLCDKKDECSLNHKITDPREKSILQKNGVSLNESPRDILNIIAGAPLVKESIKKLMSKDSDEKDQNSPSVTSSTGKVSENTLKDDKNVSESKSNKPSKVETIWSDGLKGDVTRDEICYYSVEGYCMYEESGCWRLHSSLHYYWQVKAPNGLWVNLCEDQVKALEKAYCDVNTSTSEVPVLEPSKLSPQKKGLVSILKGKSKWKADFEAMKLCNVATKEALDLRRLCTETTNNETPKPCIFKWYFSDKNQNWIEYGEIDSTGEENLKCDADSKTIETHFKQTPNSPLSFSNQSFSYILDLANMVQTNLSTNVSRAVRRRPAPHIEDEDCTESGNDKDLPAHWEVMQQGERYRRVTLDHSSSEFKKLETFVQNKGGKVTILKIERVQNPYHYRAFQNKVQEMKTLYKNDATVNVQQLFHGTNPDTVPKICEGNFDWRLHGSNAGHSWGRGTYFSPIPSTSYGYTKPDTNGSRFMFVAQVAVGKMTVGSSGLARPPINPQYNVPFDTTANALQNPSIIVKYEMQEYFPEYILTLS